MKPGSNSGTERRACTGLEVRDGANGRPVLRGHAAVFNSPSQDLGGFVEYIAPGAFSDAIGRDDVRALFNHDSNYVLGRTKPGTLRLTEDSRGLANEIDVPDVPWANDLVQSIRRGDIDGQSFQFRTDDDKWEIRDGKNVRTLLKVRLFDVGPVTFPAYPAATIGARSLATAAGLSGDDILTAPELLHALVRAERQMAPQPGDARSITRAIERLTALRPTESGAPEVQAQDAARDTMRRQLALVEATL